MTYIADVLASSPIRYWPLNETSGTSAAELVAGVDNGTAHGIAMGGADGPEGIGGKAPLFSGLTSEYITLKTAAILGGTNPWSVAAWVRYSASSGTDTNLRSFYSEQGTSGNDLIRCAVTGQSFASSLSLGYGIDSAQVTRTSGSTFIVGSWNFVVYTRTGSTYGLWYDAGGRLGASDLSSANTWTNSGIEARISTNVATATTSWIGRVAHLALYDRVLTVDEMWDLYQSGSPLARPITTRTKFFHPTKAIWNQRLDDPANPPGIAANSSVIVSNFVAQTHLSNPSVSTLTPIYLADSSTPTQAVRIQGGKDFNPSTDKPALWNSLQTVPIPTPFNSEQITTDHGATIYNVDTEEFRDFWIMQKALTPPAFVTAVVDPATPGTLPAGGYGIYVTPTLGGGVGSTFKGLASPYLADGSHAVRINWSAVEGADGYNIYVSGTNQGFTTARLVAHVGAATLALTYNGGPFPGTNLLTAEPIAVTPDWGCAYAGYQANATSALGFYAAPRANWGQTATSLPSIGGTVTITDAIAAREGNVDAIQHAHTMALLQSTDTHVFPAQRHDFWGGGNAIPEGTRLQLDPAYDLSIITNPFVKAMMKAYQVFGGYIADHSGGIAVGSVEGNTELGRNPYPYIFSGLQGYELFVGRPWENIWSSFRVIDPAWTQAQAGTIPTPPNTDAPHWGIRL
jgi:hypothetical protein